MPSLLSFAHIALLAAAPPIVSHALMLPRVGAYSRSIVHTDALESQMVLKGWKPPEAGDKVTTANGDALSWSELPVAADGTVKAKGLGGAYCDLIVNVSQEEAVVLSASAYAMVYVNGAPHTGDPYGNGMVHIPIRLRAGRNDLLFLCEEDTLKAVLTAPRADAQLDTSDPTLPDLILDKPARSQGALVALNSTGRTLSDLRIEAAIGSAHSVSTPLPPLTPYSLRKEGFRLQASSFHSGSSVPLTLRLFEGRKLLDTAHLSLRLRAPGQTYKVTFVSGIDGSVQYYAVNPANPLAKNGPPPALAITLHGAGVEAIGQADAYESKSWITLVAPTNRRPFGFDWEDWGRMDALEVRRLALESLKADPHRVYLIGHSMGGHGTWQVGSWFPTLFAAIGPSAGWVSFYSYVGASLYPDTPVGALLNRADDCSNTLLMGHNYAQEGVYIIHGGSDHTVPVTEARNMVKYLSAFSHDYRYHEQPGADHWWDANPEPGADCVDWAPLFDFLARHYLPPRFEVRRVDFTTVNPGVSARDEWAVISQQNVELAPSHIHIRVDPGLRRFVGTTQNVARLNLQLGMLPPDKPLSVTLDGQTLKDIPWPLSGILALADTGGAWAEAADPAADSKNPLRYGPFKEAFNHDMLFVYGTHGTPEENRLAYCKARYDEENFWYRGNGSVDIMPDTAFSTGKFPDRSVILYGNADTNSAWKTLLPGSPVEVKEGEVQLGGRKWSGNSYACFFVQPRPGSSTACVAAISASGPAGMRLTYRLPVFISGVAWPDCTVIGADALTDGLSGIKAAGFFGPEWGMAGADFVYGKEQPVARATGSPALTRLARNGGAASPADVRHENSP